MSIAHDMLEGVLEALWLTAWASAVEENGGRLPHHITMETADRPPAAAKKAAKFYARALAHVNGGTLAKIYERASAAEGGGYVDGRALGYYLTMQGMGHGVSWFDDHPEFPVRLPSAEVVAYPTRGGRWGFEMSGPDFRFMPQPMTWDEGKALKESLMRKRTPLRDPSNKKQRREQTSGSFIVELNDGRFARFHDMSRARAWAESRLAGAPPGAQAAFFRAQVSKHGPAHHGSPFTEPFYMLEINENGRIVVAGSGSYSGWTRAPRRDPSSMSRADKKARHAQRAREFTNMGREAEMNGDYRSAAVWYGKASAEWAKSGAGNKIRARMWKRRSKDIRTGGRVMGHLPLRPGARKPQKTYQKGKR